jgi:hypothetical protein
MWHGTQALEMHKAMYRGKLRDCLIDSRIDDEDAKALARTARLLCLTPEQVGEIDAELKGSVLQTAVRTAMTAGIERCVS